jgi:hypothetical protein
MLLRPSATRNAMIRNCRPKISTLISRETPQKRQILTISPILSGLLRRRIGSMAAERNMPLARRLPRPT